MDQPDGHARQRYQRDRAFDVPNSQAQPVRLNGTRRCSAKEAVRPRRWRLSALLMFILGLHASIVWAGAGDEHYKNAGLENPETGQRLAELMQGPSAQDARSVYGSGCEEASRLVRDHFQASTTYDSAVASFPSLEPYSGAQHEMCGCLIDALVVRLDGDSSVQLLVMDIERFTGMNPGLVMTLLEAIYASLYPFEHVWWGPQAHAVLISLSANDALGNHGAGPRGSVREQAWNLRMLIYKDRMPQADALTMKPWRTGALLDVYNRYYIYAWCALLPLAFLALKYRRRSPKARCFQLLLYPVPLVGGLYVISLIASIGHGYANSAGMLYVWRLGFWIFLGTVVLAYLQELRNLWQTRTGRSRG